MDRLSHEKAFARFPPCSSRLRERIFQVFAGRRFFTALGCGIAKPALLLRPDGRFLLHLQAKPCAHGLARMGVTVAERLGGPYAIQPPPITANQRMIANDYALLRQGRVCLLTTDSHGLVERGGGLLWHSVDGLALANAPVLAFHRVGRHGGAAQHRLFGTIKKLVPKQETQ